MCPSFAGPRFLSATSCLRGDGRGSFAVFRLYALVSPRTLPFQVRQPKLGTAFVNGRVNDLAGAGEIEEALGRGERPNLGDLLLRPGRQIDRPQIESGRGRAPSHEV